MTNFSSSLLKRRNRDPYLAILHDVSEKNKKKTGIGQNAMNWAQVMVEAIFVKSRQGVMKYRLTCEMAYSEGK